MNRLPVASAPVRSALLALVLPLVVACGGDAATAPADGRLIVRLQASPAGVAPAVTVTGPAGFRRTVTATDTLDGLAAGSYLVEAAPVVVGADRYRASPAEQSVPVVAGTLARTAPIGYALASARLAVAIGGLPAGAAASVTVAGPDGFSRVLAAGDTLDLLEPGAYTLAAADVQADGRTWRGDPATRQLTLAASTVPSPVELWYGAGAATLAVDVTGLPDGAGAPVVVTGPGGFARALAASATLRNLDPGSYTVAAAVTGRDLTTYRPDVASLTVALSDGAAGAAAVAYTGAPLALALAPVVEGLANPVLLTAPAGDARAFVVERPGRVRVVRDGALLPTPFVDIAARVNSTGERGLLGMAFDPAYATNGQFFLYYVNVEGNMAIERFTSTPGSDVATGSAGMVLTIPHGGNEHHGGTIAFGPDGMLYVAPGDGRCCGDPDQNAQDLTTLLGKLLRLDVRTAPYAVPPDNPYVGQAGRRPEIWASGLRNPWRFSFDRTAGTLYIGDVGQDAREEINAQPATAAGLNYGWRFREGSACYIPSTNCVPNGVVLTGPTVEYTHDDGCSVTGGHVYRGAAIPELAGHYLYADFCRGWLRSFQLVGGRATTERSWSGVSLPFVVSFGEDGRGELYMLSGARVWRVVRGE